MVSELYLDSISDESATCEVCGSELWADGGNYGVPVGMFGHIVPNCYTGPWCGKNCCKLCWAKHAIWSEHYRRFTYYCYDGRDCLTDEELVDYLCHRMRQGDALIPHNFDYDDIM